ncbi:fibronectin type III domain-containing protein, partial [Bacillus pumilus]
MRKSRHPKAPQNLSFTATSDSITVTWDAVEGATSYNVYRGADK